MKLPTREGFCRVCVPVAKAFIAAVVVLLFCAAVHVCKVRWMK